VDDVHLTKSGVLAGTPEYMSPEQAHAEPVDGRSDLFSLGSVLYACCTGRSPFRADSTMAALRRVCEDTPRPIREINPDIPDWLVEIIDRLLTKDRDQRFESASDVAELLGEHLAHLQHPTDVPQPARLKPSATAAPSRPNRFLRRRWIAGAAAALVVLVAGLGVTEGTGLTRVVATVIELWTPHGILIIETDDPDIEIAISGDGEEVIFTGAGVRKITVPIDVLFEVKGKKDGNTFFDEVVRITRNGERVTRVRVAPPELDTVILEIGESEKPVEVNVSEDKEITITDPNDGQEIRITVERGKQILTLRKAGFATETMKFNLTSKDGRRVCVTFVPERQPLTTAELSAKLSAEEQAAVALRGDILLIDRDAPKPALVAFFYARRRSLARRFLQDVSTLTSMCFLDLRRSGLADADLEHLANLNELQFLNLSGTSVSDAGLKHLSGLTNLQTLRLENTQVSVAGVMELQKALPECLIELASRVRQKPPSNAKLTADENAAIAELCLLGGEIVPIDRGAGRPALLCSLDRKRNLANHLQRLSVLTNTCLLDVRRCDVADADLKHLATLNDLHYLMLNRNRVTDAGLKHLASLTELRFLRLGERQVTDAGLEHLGVWSNSKHWSFIVCQSTAPAWCT